MVKNLKLVQTIEEYISVETKPGYDLIEAGVKYEGNTGEPISQYGSYKAKFVKVRALNHVDKLKHFYKEYGEYECISKYLAWLDKHHQAMMTKYPDIFKKAVELTNLKN